MTGLLLGLALACPGVAVAGDDAPVDLRRERGWLPWRFRTVATAAKGLARERGWITHELHIDADGDGVDDKFRANDHGICGALSQPAGAGHDWQTNLPVAFVRRGPCASIDGVWDLDGDGGAEVVATSGTPDGFRWRLEVLDAAGGARRWSVDLPAGSDDRGDGNWDGFFRAFGPFTAHLPAGAQRALLVGIEAGYDERPRGVLALDARDGRELWRYATGAKPIAANFHIADLDGDGRQEIVLLGAGVSNLEEGDEVDGFLDHHARLFVLNDDGALRWQRQLGEAPASGFVETVDLGADGRAELVVTAALDVAAGPALFVLSGDGSVLAAEPLSADCHSLVVDPRGATATAWLTFDGAVRRYEITGSSITPGAEAVLDGAVQVALVADMVGDAAPEVLLGGAGGWNWLVDASLQPLALLDDPDYRALKGGVVQRRLADGSRRLVMLGDDAHESAEFVVEANPRGVPWGLVVAGVAVVGAAGAVWRVRKPSPTAVRALRLRLLEKLAGESHGEIGPLSTAKRMVRFLAELGGGDCDREQAVTRIRELGREMTGHGVPQLNEAIDLAREARLDATAVREAGRSLDELRKLLEVVAAGSAGEAGGDAAVVVDPAAMRRQVEDTRRCFHRLRKDVEAEFANSPTAVLARCLAAHAVGLDSLGVVVTMPAVPAPECIIDTEDLEFVLDNLVGNAVRALAPVGDRRVVVDWRMAGDLVALSLEDSGIGMSADEAAAAFEPGEGKRPGGGRGLPGSRARLRKYEGTLVIAATAPGRGTTMVLYLRPASGGGRPAEPKGRS